MHHGKTNKTNEHPKHSLKKMKQAHRARACATHACGLNLTPPDLVRCSPELREFRVDS